MAGKWEFPCGDTHSSESTAVGPSSILGQGSKIPQSTQRSPKKKKKGREALGIFTFP